MKNLSKKGWTSKLVHIWILFLLSTYTLIEIFIFCPKIQLWFPEKIVDFFGWKTRENVGLVAFITLWKRLKMVSKMTHCKIIVTSNCFRILDCIHDSYLFYNFPLFLSKDLLHRHKKLQSRAVSINWKEFWLAPLKNVPMVHLPFLATWTPRLQNAKSSRVFSLKH